MSAPPAIQARIEIFLREATRRYGREIIFQKVDHHFTPGSRTAILGPNGSGKSTLLQLAGGALMPTEGKVEHLVNGRPVETDEVYRHVAIAAPYMGLYEDLSLSQTILHHGRSKPFRSSIADREVARMAYLEHAWDKPLTQFSSGMKQRLKLAMAILSDTPLLLLDEPASNLDAAAIQWYRELLNIHGSGRTVLIASNHQLLEHDMCGSKIEMGSLK